MVLNMKEVGTPETSRRLARRVRASWLMRVGLALFLTACAAEQVEDPLGYDQARASRLFSNGYQHISEIYIEDLAMSDLAQAGMGGLSQLDSELSLQPDGDAITLSYRDHLVSRLPVPNRENAGAWGALTASAGAGRVTGVECDANSVPAAEPTSGQPEAGAPLGRDHPPPHRRRCGGG